MKVLDYILLEIRLVNEGNHPLLLRSRSYAQCQFIIES